MKLRLSGEAAPNKEFIVEQGKTFSLSFECVDASEELITLGTYTCTCNHTSYICRIKMIIL